MIQIKICRDVNEANDFLEKIGNAISSIDYLPDGKIAISYLVFEGREINEI